MLIKTVNLEKRRTHETNFIVEKLSPTACWLLSLSEIAKALLLLWFLNVTCYYVRVYTVLSKMVTWLIAAHSASYFSLFYNLE